MWDILLEVLGARFEFLLYLTFSWAVYSHFVMYRFIYVEMYFEGRAQKIIFYFHFRRVMRLVICASLTSERLNPNRKRCSDWLRCIWHTRFSVSGLLAPAGWKYPNIHYKSGGKSSRLNYTFWPIIILTVSWSPHYVSHQPLPSIP